MLRDEENAKYRSYLKKTIEFDPDVLKRYVNFMSNPDERTAIDQFGTGDKYFGVCTLLATLPGLPMFGHGQIEGYTERYGMEFKRARMDEHPNDWLVGRHQHEIAPLLKNRKLFAESTNFVLYDFWNDHGTVDENVFAYSNRRGDQRALILYSNTYRSTRGTIHVSAAFMDKGSGQLRQRNLADGLGIPFDGPVIFAYRDTARGLEYLRRATDIHHHGINFDLRGYQYVVLLHWRELRASAEQPWDTLCDALHGEGVSSVDDALTKLRLRPVHEALHQVINARHACSFAEAAGRETRKYLAGAGKELSAASTAPKSAGELEPKDKDKAETPAIKALTSNSPTLAPSLLAFIENGQRFFDKALEILSAEDQEELTSHFKKPPATRLENSAEQNVAPPDLRQSFRKELEAWTSAAIHLPRLEQTFSTVWPASVRYVLPSDEPGVSIEQTWSPVLAWIVLRSFSPAGITAALFDTLQLRPTLADIFSSLGIEGEDVWRVAARVRVLLSYSGSVSKPLIQSEEFWNDSDVRWLTGVNESSGTLYFNKEQFEEMLSWTQLPALAEAARGKKEPPFSIDEIEDAVSRACSAADKAGYKLETYLDLVRVKPTVPA
jgi:hypothetical protein